MANLVGDSGCNKGHLSHIVDAICRDFRQHDDGELKKLVEWSKQVKTKASTGRDGRIPRQGKHTDEFYQKLDEYLVRLDVCKGRFIIRPLNKLADRLAQLIFNSFRKITQKEPSLMCNS